MDNIKFGKFIKEARKERGLTQRALAERLHVSDKAVSKWENGVGFPDIKLLEPLAECLGVSLLELMQSEKAVEGRIDREVAEQVVADAISRSREAEEQKRRMWKVKVLLAACACGIFYLICVGIGYLAEADKDRASESLFQATGGAWHENPVFFYIWAGILVIVCGAAAIFILWKNESIGEVKIGRNRAKSILTILVDMLVVFLLHTYLSSLTINQQQLLKLSETIPVDAYITTINGSSQSGIFIRDELVQGLMDSAYVDELKMSVRLKAGTDEVVPGEWDTLNLYLEGVNCIEALNGIQERDVVWNMGEDASILRGNDAKCIVSRQLFEKNGWQLGDWITLCQYYYCRRDTWNAEVFMNPLQTVDYEIAGYVDLPGNYQDLSVASPDVVVPFHTVRQSFGEEGIPFFASSASFVLSDTLQINEFKQEMKELGLVSVESSSTDVSLNGVALQVEDAAFINTAKNLRQEIDIVGAFFPLLLCLIVCVGYLVTLLLMQSRKNEMALLRATGVSRRKCFRLFFADQLALVLTGIVAGSVLSVLIQGNYGGRSALTGSLVGICYMAGNSLALWRQSGRLKGGK